MKLLLRMNTLPILNPYQISGHESSGRHKLFFTTYNSLLKRFDATGMARSQSQVIAASWAVCSVVEDDDKISSVVCRAFATQSVGTITTTILGSTLPDVDDYN